MKIYVISRSRMLELLKNKNFNPEKYNIISIRNHDIEPILNPSLSLNVLNLQFSDVDENDEMKSGEILFSEDHAREIIWFLENLDTSKDLIVHCHMGISRSGAVGDFARVRFNIPFEEFMVLNRHIQPNGHILKVLFKVQNEIDYMDDLSLDFD